MKIDWKNFLRLIFFFAIKAESEMPKSERIRRTVFSLGIFMSAGALIWMGFLFFLGLDFYSLIPGIYILLTAINLFFIHDMSPSASRMLQIGISLFFPFMMQAIMGGYYASGLVILWSAVSFLATFTLSNSRAIIWWIIIFLILFTLSFIYDADFQSRKSVNITYEVSRNLLVFNLLAIGCIIFLISMHRIEIDQLVINKLEEANQKLNSAKDDLEEKIAERTKDLETNVFVLRETKNEMKKALAQAKEATESKSLFLTTISHEIRTPLNAILGYSQLIDRHSENLNLPADIMNYLGGIRLSGNHLLELVNNFLDISRIDSGKLTLSSESVNIRLLLKKIYEIGSGKCQEKGITCSLEVSPSVPDLIETDSSKLTQILLNLLSNAMKFTPSGKKVGMMVYAESETLIFKVMDEGKGIRAEDIPGIFDPFIQLQKPSGFNQEGSGLGLAITSRLVGLFGGQISVESEEHVGSVFIVKLPLKKAWGKDESYEADLKKRKVRFLSGQKVLVVEDNPVNVQLLQTILQDFGLTVASAGNGKEGIEKMGSFRPDVVLMDIHMPVMDGYEALKRIMSMDEFRAIPVICLTADVFGKHKEDHLAMGFSDHLTKPIDFVRLISILEKYLLTDLS